MDALLPAVVAAILLWAMAFATARLATRRPPVFPLSPARRFAERLARPLARVPRLPDAAERADTVRIDLPEAPEDPGCYWPTLGSRELIRRLGVDPERALVFEPHSVEAEMWSRVLDTRAYRAPLAPFLRGDAGASFAVHRGDLVLAAPDAARRAALGEALHAQGQAYAEPLAERLRSLPDRLLTPGPFIHGDVARTYPIEAVLVAYAGTPHADRALDMLAHWVQSPAQAEREQVRALELLASHAPAARLSPVLEVAVRRGSNAVTRLAFALLREGRGRASVTALEGAAARSQFAAELVELVAQRFERDPEAAEAVLIAVLRGGASGAPALEAVRTLGNVGGIAAVRHLTSLSPRLGLGGVGMARAIDAAVARIQARLGGVVAGGLSVVEAGPDEGGLSLVERDGAVSLVESEPEGVDHEPIHETEEAQGETP
jgi:hypothetical protein